MLMYIAVCLAYMVKGLTGFANTLVLTAIMSFERSGRDITPMDLLLSFPANVWMMLQQRRSIQWKKALPVCAVLLAGCIPGTLLLKGVSPAALKVVFGVLLIGLGLERMMRPQGGNGKGSPVLQGAVALLSGITAGLFGVGALLAAYMSRTAKDPGEYRANLGFVFVAENVFRLVLYTVTGLITLPVLVEAVKLLPCMVVGFLGGSALSRRMNPERLSRVIMAMLMLSGLALILQNI